MSTTNHSMFLLLMEQDKNNHILPIHGINKNTQHCGLHQNKDMLFFCDVLPKTQKQPFENEHLKADQCPIVSFY